MASPNEIWGTRLSLLPSICWMSWIIMAIRWRSDLRRRSHVDDACAGSIRGSTLVTAQVRDTGEDGKTAAP
jgi:hypothetical protein